MSDTSAAEQHLAAARSRWGEETVTDLTEEIVRRRGDTIPPGVTKIQISPDNPVTAETAKSILSDHGYDVFYRLREHEHGHYNRDPTTVVAVPGREAIPVEEARLDE